MIHLNPTIQTASGHFLVTDIWKHVWRHRLVAMVC